ncbi:unnamed protein product [Cuscuta campestris]|uniref:Uncharacterized protein n=1 Tax=Cuscuta campestris TaxID=132261 RepID=A0A484NCT5_9ASTE|nr:unnamed protein product [Cuscuta campestris]
MLQQQACQGHLLHVFVLRLIPVRNCPMVSGYILDNLLFINLSTMKISLNAAPLANPLDTKTAKKPQNPLLVKELPGTRNTALAVAVPLLQTVDTTLKLVAKQVDSQNQDGANENDTTSVETNSPAQVETNLIQSDQKSEAINLEQILEPGAETLEIDHEVQSASDTYTNMARVEALATTIVNGRDAKAPEPAGKLEQICVGEDAQETIQNPTYTDPNSEIEQSCVAHKLSPKTDLEGTQYEEEFPPLTTTTEDFPAQNYNSDAHTLSLEKEIDGTLSPSIKGDDETISDPSFSTSFFPPVTNNAGNDQTTIGPVLQSFEVDGQHYEIRSYEGAETSNLRDDPNDFQDVQNRRSKKAGKRGTAPRTIKTRSYDPNLEVGTVSEITRYWPSRKSTTMEKIVTTKSYSGPFWYVDPSAQLGQMGKGQRK